MASSKQEYLKRYASEAEKTKKKKKRKPKTSKGGALTIMDGDPVWQKDVKEASSESDDDLEEDAPLVIKDVEFKRMQRMEVLRMRPYIATAADGSGWISVNENQNQESPNMDVELPKEGDSKRHSCKTPNLSPSQKKHGQGLSPSRCDAQHDDVDLSPERGERKMRKSLHDTPDRYLSPSRRDAQHNDVAPTRRDKNSNKRRHDTPDRDFSPLRRGAQHNDGDYSPTRRDRNSNKRRHDTPDRDFSPPRRDAQPDDGNVSPERTTKYLRKSRHGTPDVDLSPPRHHAQHDILDLSPPRREKDSKRSHPDTTDREDNSVSPRRRRLTTSKRGRHNSPNSSPLRTGNNQDLSPPRRRQTSSRMGAHDKDDRDLSPKRRSNRNAFDSKDLQKYIRMEAMADGTAVGLQSGRQLAKETDKKKQDDSKRLKELEMSISGRHASTVYRDKHGKRLEGVDEILKLQQAEEPKKEEKPLEWGKGLVQKREAEARHAELEAEKIKPFARTRDDPDLDKSLKEQVRWGDPMAHLVKKKFDEPVLKDLGASEQMKDSGFIVPQAIPKHSWLKRGITPPDNRYGIKPGRHWDGVDRSTGYEKGMYKKQNEKKAEQLEAYLWSVADM